MLSTGNYVLQSHSDSSSSWIIQWQTNSYSDLITTQNPSFVVQMDNNLVVNIPAGCSVCQSWQANQTTVCCATYHFIIHNDGYAYLLNNNNELAGFTTNSNSQILSYSPPTTASEHYIYLSNQMDYDEATAYCIATYGTTLASIHSPSDTQEVNALCSGEDCWIGLDDRDNLNSWIWQDGTSYDYDNWYPGQPDNIQHQCVYIWNAMNQQWGDHNCNKQQPFLCNRFPVTTTHSPTQHTYPQIIQPNFQVLFLQKFQHYLQLMIHQQHQQ